MISSQEGAARQGGTEPDGAQGARPTPPPEPPPAPPAPPPTMALRTYSLLRLGMICVILALLVSVAFEVARSNGCVQRSISAYYYTPARPVYVAALVTLGVSMIVIWGKNWVEDGFLNLAGMLAPVVAFVPTSHVNLCGLTTTSRQSAAGQSVQAVNRAHEAIDNNVQTFGVVIIVAMLGVFVAVLTGSSWARIVRDRPGAWYLDRTFCVPFGLALALWIFGAAVFTWDRSAFYRRAHYVSAGTMFVFLIVVVAAGAWGNWDAWKQHGRQGRDRYWSWMLRYGVLALLMVVAAIGIILARVTAPGTWFGVHWVFIIEGTLITLFGMFWVLQTIDRRADGAPRADAEAHSLRAEH